MNILKLERILNHQQHLHYNIPYNDDDYSDYREASKRADKAEENLRIFGIFQFKQNLVRNFHLLDMLNLMAL